MRIAIASLRLLSLSGLCHCADPNPATSEPPLELHERYGLDATPQATRAVDLRWQPPTACQSVYRVQISEQYPPGLEDFLHTQAEQSTSFLALPPATATTSTKTPRGPLVTGHSQFVGPRTVGKILRREFAASPHLLGPASPDAPCYERTWDPVEDALALGWPELPGRLVGRGETWRGARVEARCNRSACVDPKTRGGGPDNHMRPCATMSWRERLDGMFWLGDEPVAVVSGFWSDGHALDEGLWSERSAVISLAHGRLLVSHTTIHHNYLGIERDIFVEAVDDCPGSLLALGFAPEPHELAARDAFLAALAASPAASPATSSATSSAGVPNKRSE